MTAAVRDAYDANAELYASLFLDELDRDAQSKRLLAALAERAAQCDGPVADLGCGPGSTVAFLDRLGCTPIGFDISPGQIAQARRAHPDLRFDTGDLTQLDVDEASLGGIVSRHSIIHLPPSELPAVFEEWLRALQPGAPMFVSFFGSRSATAHGTPFDHKVITAYELSPATVGQQLEAAGFIEIVIDASPIPEGGRPFDHTTILTHKPSA